LYKVVIIALLIVKSVCIAQTDSTYYYFSRESPEEILINKINSVESSEKDYYKLIYFSKIRDVDSVKKYIQALASKEPQLDDKLAKYYYFKAYYYKIIDNDSLAYLYHTRALKTAESLEDSETILSSLSGLAQSWDYNDSNHYRIDFLNRLGIAAEKFDNNSFKIIHKYLEANYYLFRDEAKKSSRAYQQVLKMNFGALDSVILLNTYNNLGALYNTVVNKPDSAIYFYKKELTLINSSKKFGYPKNYFNIYNNLGAAYSDSGQFDKALGYFKLAKNYNTTENILFNDILISENLANVNDSLKNYKVAYSSLREVIKLSDSLNEKEHQESIARIKEGFDNKQLQKDIITEKKEKKILWITGGLVLIAVTIIGFLAYKNTKRKKDIAEKQREIEINKTEKILKEQEINTIDAMISGQEKERQRLASDLHDSVGATLAAARLQFEHLHKNRDKGAQTNELFDKTSKLLEDAYTEVRNMSHIKNSGVIAKQGLLPAVQKLARNASVTSALQIEVQDFGLNERLENTLEISVFRILQELVTNIIKHAEASEASISITQHEESLSIIVEDNGKGFTPLQIQKKEGMGLNSIERRIEHIEGTMEVDSTLGKGTSILIDIPL